MEYEMEPKYTNLKENYNPSNLKKLISRYRGKTNSKDNGKESKIFS